MEAKTKDLWVFIETNEDGSPKKVGLELLNPGRMMADKQGGKLVAVVIGDNVAESVEQAGIYGADQVIVVEGPEYKLGPSFLLPRRHRTYRRLHKPGHR